MAAIALIGLGSWLAVAQQARAWAAATAARNVTATRLAAQRIEQLLPRQRLELSVATDGVYDRDVTLGLAWALRAAGYEPAVDHRAARYLGPRYLFAGRPMPHVTVLLRHRAIVVRLTPSSAAGVPQARPGAWPTARVDGVRRRPGGGDVPRPVTAAGHSPPDEGFPIPLRMLAATRGSTISDSTAWA